MADCLKIIEKFYSPDTKAHRTLIEHGARVAEKALQVADKLNEFKPDRDFIYESALLHDIGMIYTDAKSLGCFGNHPYIAHGILGRLMLQRLGFERHGFVCERHIGVGLTKEDIIRQKLPVPVRDMIPLSLEEKIVCYADKFYSKTNECGEEKTTDQILKNLSRFGREKAELFLSWMEKFY